MEADDFETRTRELEIASSVHSINTKRLETNMLSMAADIRAINKSIDIGRGRNGIVNGLVVFIATVLIGFFGWIAVSINSNTVDINKILVTIKNNKDNGDD